MIFFSTQKKQKRMKTQTLSLFQNKAHCCIKQDVSYEADEWFSVVAELLLSQVPAGREHSHMLGGVGFSRWLVLKAGHFCNGQPLVVFYGSRPLASLFLLLKRAHNCHWDTWPQVYCSLGKGADSSDHTHSNIVCLFAFFGQFFVCFWLFFVCFWLPFITDFAAGRLLCSFRRSKS